MINASQFKKSSNTRTIESEDDLVWVHHVLMKEYGYISVKEFGDMTLATIWNFLDCIQEDKEAEQKEIDKSKRKK